MTRVCSAVLIPEQSVIADNIVVRTQLPFLHGHRRDAQRQAADSGFEDALRCLEGNAFTIEEEAALQLTPIEELRGLLPPSVQECKRGKPHAEVGRIHAEILPKSHGADLVGLSFGSLRPFAGVFG